MSEEMRNENIQPEQAEKELEQVETSIVEETEEIASENTGKKQGFFKRLFSKKNFKWLLIAGIALILAIGTATFFIVRSCNGKEQADEKIKGYLTLNAYSITLFEGETYQLELTKFNEKDEAEDIKEAVYTSEVPAYASVDNGLITAVRVGKTYIQIEADGLSTSCFVTVVEAKKEDGFEIRTAEDVLYKGVPAQLYVLVTENGVVSNFTGAITWSVEDESVLKIVDGKVTALKTTDSAKIFAKFTHKDVERTIEMVIKVEEPYVYSASLLEFKLASAITLAGNANDKHVSGNITFERYNPITKVTEALTASDFEVSSRNTEIITVEKDGNSVKATAKVTGSTMIDIPVTGTNRSVAVKAMVVNTIASIEDMDALSLAVYSNPDLMSSSFMMVQDIDYEGKVIYPIATSYQPYNKPSDVNDKSYQYGYNRVIGMQWKYILEVNEVDGKNVYNFLDREKVGKLDETKAQAANARDKYYGLTDFEFMTLSTAGGLNPKNSKQFKGTFDGNGYSIKNAKVMNDAFLMDCDDGDSDSDTSSDNFKDNKVALCGAYASVFTYLNDATVKNVAFENLSLQSLEDFTCENWAESVKPLYYYYCPGMMTEIGETTTDGSKVINGYSNFSLIAMSWGADKNGIIEKGATVENVYLSVDHSSLSSMPFGDPGALIQWTKQTKVLNCVVNVQNAVETNGTTNKPCHAIANTDDSRYKATFNNNLVIGVSALVKNSTDDLNDNCFVKDNNWTALKTALESKTTILNSFNSLVWDMAGFNAGTGAPKLVNGCSSLK